MTEDRRFLGAPVFSLQTMLRKISEENHQILPLIPDGVYGPNTYASVRSFQEAFDLPATGTTDLPTWRLVVREYDRLLPDFNYRYDPEIENSIFPTDLRVLQAKLLTFLRLIPSSTTLQVTGELDDNTIRALQWIQKTAGLEVSGKPDIQTQRAIDGIFINDLLK